EVARSRELALAAREGEEDAVEAGHMLGLLLLKRGAEDAREVSHRLGGQEVVLHEALDGGKARMAGIAEPFGNLALDVEMQPLLRLSGQEMHVAAHGPQEILRLAELQVFVAGENALVDQFPGLAYAVVIFADPEKRMQVAQPALAVLHIGFDQIAAFARLGVPGVTLSELCLDVFGSRVLDDLSVEAGNQLVVKGLLAADVARFQNSRTDGDVRLRVADTLVHRARRVA